MFPFYRTPPDSQSMGGHVGTPGLQGSSPLLCCNDDARLNRRATFPSQTSCSSPWRVHPPGSGTTPLHPVAPLGRVDAVNLVLEQENIDDSLRDGQGKTCREVARGKEVVRANDDSRSFLNASYCSLLRSHVLSPLSEAPLPSLLQLLGSSPTCPTLTTTLARLYYTKPHTARTSA